MTEVISKTTKIQRNAEEVYNYLSDFRNLDDIVPRDKITDWYTTEDQCHFKIEGLGKAGMQITEKEPPKLIKLSSLEDSSINFNFWLQLKQIDNEDTRIRVVIKAKLNPLMKAMVSKHLQQGADSIVDKLADFFNNRSDLQ
ncbi:MAG: hypothetical protein ACLFUW_04200 [Bacteroidales bacterium]